MKRRLQASLYLCCSSRSHALLLRPDGAPSDSTAALNPTENKGRKKIVELQRLQHDPNPGVSVKATGGSELSETACNHLRLQNREAAR
jgi:hypothetical protein